MDTEAFDRLARRIGRSGNRRAAIWLLLGAAATGTSLGTGAARAEPPHAGTTF